jgi:hypothetical protein
MFAIYMANPLQKLKLNHPTVATWPTLCNLKVAIIWWLPNGEPLSKYFNTPIVKWDLTL